MRNNLTMIAAGAAGAAILLAGVLLLMSATFVWTGHLGVVSSFGKVEANTLDEGLHFVAPWKSVHKVSLQTKEDKESATVPTKEGLSVGLEASLLYSVSPERAVEIYRTVGPDYEAVLVQSQFRSALRDATTKYEAKDLYTAAREQVEHSITEAVKGALAERGLVCEKVLLRDVQMPQVVKDRIEAKLAADQDAQRMTFVLQKEKQEAERKRVEAQGIADAQAIIKKDLDHHYLVYLWIEALKECAVHKNTTIYVPTGPDGMPLFKQVTK